MQRQSTQLKNADPVAYRRKVNARRYRRAERVPGRLAQSTESPGSLVERAKGRGPSPFRNTIVVSSDGKGYQALRHREPKSVDRILRQAEIKKLSEAGMALKVSAPGAGKTVLSKIKSTLRGLLAGRSGLK